MIKSIPSHNSHEIYKDKNINELVDFSLDNLNDDLFMDILTLITYGNLKLVDKLINKFKSHARYSKKESYDYLKSLFHSLYDGEISKEEVRGTFLELLVFKYLNSKFSHYDGYMSDLDCFIEICGNKSERTVDVFAFWGFKGFVSENKISERYFEDHDLDNLNKIYNDSNKLTSHYSFGTTEIH